MPAPIPPRLYGGNPDDRPRRPRRRPQGPARQRPAAPPGSRVPRRPPRARKTGEIAKALDRSAGAVGNALTTLAGRGEADLVPGKPVRYQANSATAAAAAAIAPKAPRRADPGPAPAPGPPPPRRPPPPPPASPAPAGWAGPGHPPERAGLPAARRWPTCPTSRPCASCATAGVPALLYGPPGTGKTSLIEAAFGDDLITVAGDGDTTVADLVGEYTQKPRRHLRVHLRAPDHAPCPKGKVLFIDDATLISPAVLAVAYPAMDGRREITVKAHKGEIDQGRRRLLRRRRPQPRRPRRDPHRGPVQQVLGPGQGLHRLRPRPRPQDRPPRHHAPPGTSPPGRPAARSAGHPSCASCSPTPRSPPSSARTPPSPTWPASPPRKTATPSPTPSPKPSAASRSPPSPSAASSSPRPALPERTARHVRHRHPPPPPPPPPGSPPPPATGKPSPPP